MTLGERVLALKNSRKHKTLCNEKEGGNPMHRVKARRDLKWALCELLVEGPKAVLILLLAEEMSCREAGVEPEIRL